jgi:hypothetical protein
MIDKLQEEVWAKLTPEQERLASQTTEGAAIVGDLLIKQYKLLKSKMPANDKKRNDLILKQMKRMNAARQSQYSS